MTGSGGMVTVGGKTVNIAAWRIEPPLDLQIQQEITDTIRAAGFAITVIAPTTTLPDTATAVCRSVCWRVREGIIQMTYAYKLRSVFQMPVEFIHEYIPLEDPRCFDRLEEFFAARGVNVSFPR